MLERVKQARGRIVLGVLLLLYAAVAAAQTNIRQVDFKNFSYLFAKPRGWPHELHWLDVPSGSIVRLVEGRAALKDGESVEGAPFRGLTLESVGYADVTGDGQESAIVVLRFDTGGTQYSHYVYIYTLASGGPKLLACFHSGDRANYGLYRVYGQRETLVVELFDPRKQEGDCCSSRFVRTRFQWRGGHFQQIGKKEFGTPTAPSRLPVDMFGHHQ